MSFGNEEIARLIELGSHAQQNYETSIKTNTGEDIPTTFRWRPLKEYEHQTALANAFDVVPRHLVKYLIADKDEKQKMKDDGLVVPSSQVRKFYHEFNVNVLFFAMQDYYDDLTVGQVRKLNIDFNDFAVKVLEASGNKKGRETVSKFPAEQEEQQSQDKTEKRGSPRVTST